MKDLVCFFSLSEIKEERKLTYRYRTVAMSQLPEDSRFWDTTWTLELNHYGKYFPSNLEGSYYEVEVVFRLDFTRINDSRCSNTDFNFYGEDGENINLHLSFRPNSQTLHIAQWNDNRWHEYWSVPFEEIVGGVDLNKWLWLAVRRAPDQGYDLSLFTVENERRIGQWHFLCDIGMVGGFTNYVNYKGPADHGLFGSSLELHHREAKHLPE